jgi:hypothetical protein
MAPKGNSRPGSSRIASRIMSRIDVGFINEITVPSGIVQDHVRLVYFLRIELCRQ